jgi:hypothetical protein
MLRHPVMSHARLLRADLAGMIALLVLVVVFGCGDDKPRGASPPDGASGAPAGGASPNADASAPDSGGTGGDNDAGGDASPDGESGSGGSAGPDAEIDAGEVAPCTAAPNEPAQFTPGAALSDADVGASFTEIAAILKARPRVTDSQAKADGIRAAVRNVPRVASTAIAPDCTVLVRLTDGTPLSIYDDSALEPVDAGTQPAELPESAQEPRALALAAPPSSVELPGSDKVLLGTIFDPTVLEAVDAVFKKRGYQPALGMTSADLRDKVQNLGVLWIQTHSSHACEDTEGNKHYCIVTGDPEALGSSNCTLNNPAHCAYNALDVLEDRASYAMSSSGTGRTFSINEAFIMRYWSFAPNSLVYIDSCGSMRRIPLANSLGWNGYVLRDAIVAKGAGTMLGWSNTVGTDFSSRAAVFFFHRVLGGDERHLPRNAASWKLTPRQRPFSVPEVKAVLHAKGWDRETPREGNRFGSYLVIEQHSEASTILAPSLRNVTIGDPAVATTVKEKAAGAELHLFGQFGTKPGLIAINEASVALNGSWDSTHLVVSIPKNGSTSGGPVRVEVTPSSRAITSNSVPLTSWRGTARTKVTYTTSFGSPGPFAEINCSALHYRADIHPFRMAPDEEARAGTAGADNSFRPQIDLPNSVGDTVCGGSIGGAFANATVTPETRAIIPWIVNDSAAEPAHPGWYYKANGRIDTSRANAFTFAAASKFCTSAVFRNPPPVGDITVSDFCQTTAPAFFSGLTPPPLVPVSFKMLQPKVQVTTPLGDPAEIEFDLNAEFPPTPDTEG